MNKSTEVAFPPLYPRPINLRPSRRCPFTTTIAFVNWYWATHWINYGFLILVSALLASLISNEASFVDLLPEADARKGAVNPRLFLGHGGVFPESQIVSWFRPFGGDTPWITRVESPTHRALAPGRDPDPDHHPTQPPSPQPPLQSPFRICSMCTWSREAILGGANSPEVPQLCKRKDPPPCTRHSHSEPP